MRKLLILLSIISVSCKTWEYGEVYTQHIEAGKHYAKPIQLKFTEAWGGLCVLEYDSEEMIDPEENFAYWCKLGGLMPDLTDNIGYHESARMAWRVDPEDTNYFYLGYIIYHGDVERGYLLDVNGNKMRVRVGDQFDARVIKYRDHWAVSAKYNGQYAYKRYDIDLKREKFIVGLDLYFGGAVPAPTDIWLTVETVDTNWNYNL